MSDNDLTQWDDITTEQIELRKSTEKEFELVSRIWELQCALEVLKEKVLSFITLLEDEDFEECEAVIMVANELWGLCKK